VPLADYAGMVRLVRFDLQDIRIAKVEKADPSGNHVQVTIAFRFVAPMLGGRLLDARAKSAWRLDNDGQWCKEDELIELPFSESPGRD
jgi:hypothetical protein